MNEIEIFDEIEEAVLRCVRDNDVAAPMVTIAEALMIIRTRVLRGEYDSYEPEAS